LLGADPMQKRRPVAQAPPEFLVVRLRGRPGFLCHQRHRHRLWDRKGKLLGQPVVNLIGGAYRDRLPVIASTMPSTRAWSTRPKSTAVTCGNRVTRESRWGWASGARLGYDQAHQRFRGVRALLVRRAAGADGHGRVPEPTGSRQVPDRHGRAGVECEGFARVIESGVTDVVGCDPGRAEGITGSLKVIELVEKADVWYNAHAWSSVS